MKIDLDKLLQGVKRVGIAGHVRPDGDCVGSCLGLYGFVKEFYPKAQVVVYLEDIPESFLFLKGADVISHEKNDGTVYDVFFALDCGDAQRLGAFGEYFRRAAHTVCIDHHITNPGFADENLVRADASSTSEMICDLIGMERITVPMAEALYMGIVHDTGVFQYTCTSRHTMEVGGALMDKGIDHTRIVQETFYCRTYLQQQILGRAMLESIAVLDGKILVSSLNLKTMRFYQAGSKDLEGIVSLLKNTYGAEVAVFMHEIAPMEWKVSLRSSTRVDVAAVASAFMGGGHRQAAGCSLQGSRIDVLSNLLPLLAAQLEEKKVDDV